ncbi:MAG: DEAD/DEAH box helicase, partial [Myxococcales bacterium]|nr:DEAD/DEAH box helicase [Myxococcales bacterium]
QAVKNPDTRRAAAIAALPAAFRVALTGTPVENRVGELWSLFRVVAPGLLGTRARFRERFVAPIERDGDDGARERLAALVRPFILRRDKAAVAPELPPRTDVRVDVALSRAERELYEKVRAAAEAAAASEDGGRFELLAALQRLRLLACHPRLVDPRATAPGAKLARLREIVAELREEGHRALIFSQFVRHLELVREALEADGVALRWLDGQTPPARREAEVDAFQRGEGDVFLISLRAGGTGLNLTGADYVIHVDPWWNPAVEDQATDRAHRIGQDKPVTVMRLIAAGTVEEAIVELHERKRALVDALLAGTDDAAALSVDELRALLRGAALGDEDEEGAA